MFEHLDDPNPPKHGDEFRNRVAQRVRIRRRRTVGAGFATVAVVAVVGVVGLYGNAVNRLDDVQRIEVAGTGDGPTDPDAPQTFLAVGIDEAAESAGRTDTILVMRTDPSTGQLASIAIPRDLAVENPGTGDDTRINNIYTELGLDGLVQVIEHQLGLPIDHAVQVDFAGFVRLVDLLGGIDISVPAALKDRPTGLDIAEPGCVHLDGTMALQLTRARHLETLVDGEWRTDPTGDLGRINRTQTLLSAAIQSLGSARPDPLDANRLADWIVDNVTVSQSLDRAGIVNLAQFGLQLDQTDLAINMLPVEAATLPTGAEVLQLTGEATVVIDDFTNGTPAPTGNVEPTISTPILGPCPDA